MLHPFSIGVARALAQSCAANSGRSDRHRQAHPRVRPRAPRGPQGRRAIRVFVINHGSDTPFADQPDENAWIRSMYFRDPANIAFDFPSLPGPLGTRNDLASQLKNAKGERIACAPLLMQE